MIHHITESPLSPDERRMISQLRAMKPERQEIAKRTIAAWSMNDAPPVRAIVIQFPRAAQPTKRGRSSKKGASHA